MYRRIAFAAADLSLAVGGLLLVWAFVRPHADFQRLYGILLGFAALLVGSVQLAGAMNLPAAGPDGLAAAPAAVAGDPGRGGGRGDHRWYRHSRGGDHPASIPNPDPGPCASPTFHPFPVRCPSTARKRRSGDSGMPRSRTVASLVELPLALAARRPGRRRRGPPQVHQ
jgi:hypothetical protein